VEIFGTQSGLPSIPRINSLSEYTENPVLNSASDMPGRTRQRQVSGGAGNYSVRSGYRDAARRALAGGTAGGDRDRLVENWLRVARMSKDGVITALEQGFELWEREIRRTVATAKGGSQRESPNSMDAWTENWRRATEAFSGGTGTLGEEARKQARGRAENPPGWTARMATAMGTRKEILRRAPSMKSIVKHRTARERRPAPRLCDRKPRRSIMMS
jgi:hypothetical protein